MAVAKISNLIHNFFKLQSFKLESTADGSNLHTLAEKIPTLNQSFNGLTILTENVQLIINLCWNQRGKAPVSHSV